MDRTVAAESTENESLESYFESLDLRSSPRRTRPSGGPSKGRKRPTLLLSLLLAVLFVLLIRQYVLQHNTVIGSSMIPALADKDEILIEKVSRHFTASLKRGAIVTADRGSGEDADREYVIKRIIGLPGERVTIREGGVLINGQRLDESYLDDWVLTDARLADYSDLLLGKDEYYLMGDNRSCSRDSRDVGPFCREEIVGCLILRFFPFDQFGKPK